MVLSGYLCGKVMILKLSKSFKVQIKYVFKRGDTLYWQRKIPKDLAERYGGTQTLKINLNTNDPSKAARLVARYNQQYEAIWEAMRGNIALTPATVKAQAHLLLKQHGLSAYGANNHDEAIHQFIETVFEPKREKLALESDNPDETYSELKPENYASPVEVSALEILLQKPKFLLSDAVRVYLDGHVKRSDEKFRTYTNRAWERLLAIIGDKPFDDTSRSDAC